MKKKIEDFYRRSTASMRVLPQYQIIGAQKCGTSSLFSYLAAHPRVYRSYRKEVHYFDLNYDKPVNWYQSHFSYRWQKVLSGDASPYYIYHPSVCQRLWELAPEAKLIVLLRNPVNRAYSNYEHNVRLGMETLSFEDALMEEDARLAGEVEKIVCNPFYASVSHRQHSYRSKGVYAQQLEIWLGRFPREQFLFIRSEDLYESPGPTYQTVLDFLDLQPFKVPRFAPKNQYAYKSTLDENTRERLNAFYEPWNHRLYELIDRDLGW